MDSRPDGSRVWFRPHHAIRWCWTAFEDDGEMVNSHAVPVSDRLAVAEGSRADCGAADGSGVARLWRTCGAYGRRVGFVRQAVGFARGIATEIRHGRKRDPTGRDALWDFAATDRALPSCLCEGDG